MTIAHDPGLSRWATRIDEVLRRRAVPLSAEQLLGIVVEAAAPVDAITEDEGAFLRAHAGVAVDLDAEALQRAEASVALSATRADALARDGALTTNEAATMLGTAPSNVRRSIGEGRLFSIGTSTGSHLLPRWQFTDAGRALPGLQRVLAALPDDEHPLDIAALMTTPAEALGGRTPAAWLASGGDIAKVEALADERAWE